MPHLLPGSEESQVSIPCWVNREFLNSPFSQLAWLCKSTKTLLANYRMIIPRYIPRLSESSCYDDPLAKKEHQSPNNGTIPHRFSDEFKIFKPERGRVRFTSCSRQNWSCVPSWGLQLLSNCWAHLWSFVNRTQRTCGFVWCITK